MRPLVAEDKEHASAWFPDPYPINASRAEEWLKEQHKDPWARTRYLAIVRTGDDTVVGGVRFWWNGRQTGVRLFTAPWIDDAGAVRAEAIRLLVPWLRDEREMMVTSIELASDDVEGIAACEAAGCVQTARLRQHIARPGYRVDKLFYQALNPNWRIEEAPNA
jgi:RimJ/RimL family protein N-acetyltransferase